MRGNATMKTKTPVVDTPTNDAVDHPSHYVGAKIECIEAIEAACEGKDPVEAFLVGQCVKYLWRYNKKHESQDVSKARWYLDRLLKRVQERES
jgi:hypothetical protein